MSDSEAPPADRWYAKGLRFECTMCGNCCTGPPGAVWFAQDEADDMAAALGVDTATFYKRFTRRVGSKYSLKEHRTDHGFDCVFLDRESRPGVALCRLYKARPAQCRTWPFWPENLESAESWESARTGTPCPGMNAGRIIPVGEIIARLNRTPPD